MVLKAPKKERMNLQVAEQDILSAHQVEVLMMVIAMKEMAVMVQVQEENKRHQVVAVCMQIFQAQLLIL